MRRISRIDRSIGPLRKGTTTAHRPSFCLTCSHQASSFSTSGIQGSRTARPNEKVPFTDKLRQKIWATDKPPGQADPYSRESASGQNKTQQQKDEKPVEEEVETYAPPKTLNPDLSTYEPASTWDGLEHVGGFGHWWKNNWDPYNQFKGFLPAQKITDSAEVTVALHRAIVEVFALQQVGKSVADVSKAVPGIDLTRGVQIFPSEHAPSLELPDNITLDEIVQSLSPTLDNTQEMGAPTESEEDVADRSEMDALAPGLTPVDETSLKGNPTESEEDVAADRSSADPLVGSNTDYESLVASWDPAWLRISLENPEFKFAVLKRIMQLTGIRVPDHAIQSSKTAQALLNHLITPPKPPKVVDYLSQMEDLMTLPNVTVYAKRITPIDKERSVGRWKIIEKELQERGLPVTGR